MSDDEQTAGWHGPPSPSEIDRVARKVSIYGADSADLDVLCPPNRWAAFPDDELDYILDGLNLALGAERPRLPLRDGLLRWQRIKASAADVQAELAHRKSRT